MSVDRVVTSDHVKVVIFKGESSRTRFLFVSVFLLLFIFSARG